MTNGQLNVTLIPTVTQMVTPESSASIGITVDGVQQNSGDFAGMLRGMQSVSTVNTTPEAGQADLLQIVRDKDLIDTGAVADGQVTHLFMQLHVSALITPASALAETKQMNSEKTDVAATTVPLNIEPSEATSQMVLAAYSQPGRMPTSDIQPQPLADLLQNVAATDEQPGGNAAPVEKMHTDQAEEKQKTIRSVAVAMQQNVATVTEKTAVSTVPVIKNYTDPAAAEQSTIQSATVAMPQKVATVTEEPAASTVPVVQSHTDQAAVEQNQSQTVSSPLVNRQSDKAVEKEAIPSSVFHQELPDRTSSVNDAAPHPVDGLQNVAGIPDRSVPPALPDTIRIKQSSAEVVQLLPHEEPAAVLTLQAETPAIIQKTATAATPVSSPETELEIQLSQPQPITARVTTMSASVDNRFALPAQEVRGTKLRQSSEQQIEKVRTGTEQSIEKDVPTLLQSATAAGELAQDSDTSRGSEDNQGQPQPDATAANQLLEQQMHGQFKTENHKVAPLSTKMVTTEPVRQDVPEQIMQQVKERLVQHDVKPGNQQITLTLSPDNLGELKMNLNLQGQKLSVEIIAENRAVRDAIMQHTDTLKETLARQNITMESFDVTTGGKGSGNQSQNQNAWRELAKQQQLWTAPRGYQTVQAELPSSSAVYQKQQGHTMLDIHY